MVVKNMSEEKNTERERKIYLLMALSDHGPELAGCKISGVRAKIHQSGRGECSAAGSSRLAVGVCEWGGQHTW